MGDPLTQGPGGGGHPLTQGPGGGGIPLHMGVLPPKPPPPPPSEINSEKTEGAWAVRLSRSRRRTFLFKSTAIAALVCQFPNDSNQHLK